MRQLRGAAPPLPDPDEGLIRLDEGSHALSVGQPAAREARHSITRLLQAPGPSHAAGSATHRQHRADGCAQRGAFERYGTSSSFPVVWRLANASCAFAASASGSSRLALLEPPASAGGWQACEFTSTLTRSASINSPWRACCRATILRDLI